MLSDNFKSVIARTASVLGLLGALFAVMTYFNSNYVSKIELEKDQALREQQEEHMEDQFVELAEKLITSHTLLVREIRDAKAFSLIVTRDILQTRTELTPKEQAELRVIQIKLSELNIVTD